MFITRGIANHFEKMIRGAYCAECRQRLGENQIFYSADTTKRTVHWNCRTVQDDPLKET